SPLEAERVNGTTEEAIREFFDLIFSYFSKHNYHPSLIANYDETMITLGEGKVRVVVPEEARRAYKDLDPKIEHITVAPTIFADSSHTDSLIILPLKNLPKQITIEHFKKEFKELVWVGQESGWVTKEIFEDYCKTTIIPEFEK